MLCHPLQIMITRPTIPNRVNKAEPDKPPDLKLNPAAWTGVVVGANPTTGVAVPFDTLDVVGFALLLNIVVLPCSADGDAS